jgi:leader peptidase (prepilin peptidase) / N-methyltransferase
VRGLSICPACRHRLGPLDLVPLLSWVAARGRCRYCGERISAFYPTVELGALGIAAWAAATTSGPELWVSCVLGWTLLALALTDLHELLLPDLLTLPLVAAGLLVAALFRPDDLSAHVVGAVLGAAVVVAIGWTYRRLRGREGIGLGDAKLLAASGAWVSWQGLPSVTLIAALAGLAVILPGALRQRRVLWTARVPFGVFLCLGLWLVWLYGPVGASW